MAAKMFARSVSRVARPTLFSNQRIRLVSNVTNTTKPLIENEIVRGIVEYYAKKRMSQEAVDAFERLTKGKDFKVRRGKKGITIQVCASGFGHDDLKFAMVKKHLVIKGETTNLHGKSTKYEMSVPVSDWKKYDMRGLVAESKNGLVKVFIPFSKK
ncbi:hypothetical protein CTI12_AA603700 [Artemisia annua]|uniref:SHSP domain-containing protein n=1 Tax=Artemisia annua TaxID=35608 RepID=A0A2U1KH40_ARTAN|nr:hypothetical protein CTI12_AA603700 [Artemisia annua]